MLNSQHLSVGKKKKQIFIVLGVYFREIIEPYASHFLFLKNIIQPTKWFYHSFIRHAPKQVNSLCLYPI